MHLLSLHSRLVDSPQVGTFWDGNPRVCWHLHGLVCVRETVGEGILLDAQAASPKVLLALPTEVQDF